MFVIQDFHSLKGIIFCSIIITIIIKEHIPSFFYVHLILSLTATKKNQL